MNRTVDLKPCLDGWPYDAARNVRINLCGNGREIILVRRPMGLEQYEADGRPDGRKIHGMESVLEFHLARISTAKLNQTEANRELTPKECAELFEEARVYYERLVVLIRLKDWPRAERDAAHILRLIDCAKQHAQCPEDRAHLEPWRSQLTRINAAAQAINLPKQPHRRLPHQSLPDAIRFECNFHRGAAEHGMIEELTLENVRGSLAALPPLDTREENCFLQQGEYWKIRYQGHTAFLKSMRGLHCLACLLRRPEQEFHVSELLVHLLDVPIASPAVANRRQPENARQFAGGGIIGGIPILDAHAKMAYKRRVQELRQELAEAEQFNDSTRATEARDEMNLIALHLAAAIGLGGRDRKSSSAAERARCTVTKRIKKAIQKIAQAIPGLGHHLAARIKTGYFCSYKPDPDYAVNWTF